MLLNKENFLIQTIINEYNNYVFDNNLEGKYCIIFYKRKNHLKFVHKIYKNIEIFKNSVLKDIAQVSTIFGIDFELYIFD